MTGTQADPPPPIGAAYYLGICDICRHVRTFASPEARDEWEENHEHITDY